MYVEAIQSVQRALFPIFRLCEPGDGMMHIGVSGCGLFIDDRGTFATVAHAFDEAREGTQFLYWGLLPDDLAPVPLAITEIARDDAADILLGKLPIETPNFLALSQERAPVGKGVCISGYPMADITLNDQGGLELGAVRRYFRSTMVVDYVRAPCGDGRRVHHGLLLQDAALFGQSGGAVFDPAGMVVGMQAAVMKPRESVRGDSTRKIIVENAVVVSSDQIHALYDRTLGPRTVLPKIETPGVEVAVRRA